MGKNEINTPEYYESLLIIIETKIEQAEGELDYLNRLWRALLKTYQAMNLKKIADD